MATSNIVINLQSFNLITTGQLCPISTITADTGDNRVTVVDGTIKVKPITGSPTDDLILSFTLQVNGVSSNAYGIKAVVFKGNNVTTIFTNQSKGNGTVNPAVNDPVTVKDVWSSSNLGSWELYLIVSQGAGANIGLVDPPIENDAA